MRQVETSHAGILQVTTDNFKSLAIDDPTPILLDFWAPWCGPCRMMGPILDEVSGLLAGSVRIGKVNVDEEPRLADAFGVQGIPTLVLMREGKAVDAFSGVMPAAALSARIKGKL